MTIDPRFSFWLSISLAVMGFLSCAGGQFTDLGLEPVKVKALLALIALIIGVGNAINAVLAAIPSPAGQTKGFYLGPTPPPAPPPNAPPKAT
jgi:hypothetical protein